MSTPSAAICPSELQRARGRLGIAIRRRGEASVLADLHQEGCLKARFPQSASWPEAVLLNNSGGIAAGDVLGIAYEVQTGAHATFTTATAERVYRAREGEAPACVHTRITVAERGMAEYLPQETILFDGAALDRRLDVELATNAIFIGVESLVFGRLAMGERVHHLRLVDTLCVRRAGRLILHDATRLAGDADAALQYPTVAKGGAAVATLLLVAPEAESRLDILRAAWAGAPAETGASAWDGMLVGRIVARDSMALRATMALGIRSLRNNRSLPRVWQF